MADNKQIAADVLEAVGGKDNVTYVAHCMTRLRFNLKDIDVPDANAVKKIKGVLGAQISGGQFQVIVGQNVPKVYDELCKMGGFAKQEAIDENLDTDKGPLTPAKVGNSILGYLSGSMVPMIPILLSAGLFKTIAVLFGPSMLNVIAEESDLYVLMDMLYNAAFYFMPIYLGYNAAKQIGATPALGAFLGGVLIEPTFVQMAADGTPFTVYGIPCTPASYAQTVIPILLTVFVMYYIEKGLKKVMPDALTTVFTPFLTLAITVPISLCLLAPLGSWLGTLLAAFFNFFAEQGGIVAVLGGGLLGMLWLPMVVTGMHIALIMLATVSFMTTGVDSFFLVATGITLFSGYGVEFASWLKLRDKHEKSQALGYFIANTVGGVGEPFIYGLLFRYRRLWPCCLISSFVAGAVAVGLGVKCYVGGAGSNVLKILAFMGGGTQNLVFAIIAAAVGFILGAVLTFLFGFTEDELENGPVDER